jgi:hypothetical protein
MNFAPSEIVKSAPIGGIVNPLLPYTWSPTSSSSNGFVVNILTLVGFANELTD